MRWWALLLVIGWLGHAPAFSQQPFWRQTAGPGGGFVHGLVAAPDGDLFAVVGDETYLHNRVYRSEDDGETWSALMLPDDEILTLAVGPDGTLFAARERGGVFRSRDDGQTWETLDVPADLVRAFAFSDQGTLFAATVDGVYRSEDDGTSWERAGLEGLAVNTVVTAGPQKVVAATFEQVYVSTDGGISWTEEAATRTITVLLGLPDGTVYVGVSGLPNFGDAPGVYRLQEDGTLSLLGVPGLSVTALARNREGHLFAGTQGLCTGFVCASPAGVFRSVNEGMTWESAGLLSTGVHALAVNAQGDLLAGTQGLFTDTGPLFSRGIVRSADEGATWTPSSRGIPQANTYALAAGPAGALYAAADHSVFGSTDRGATWTALYTDEPAPAQPWAPYYQPIVHPDGSLFVLAGHPPRLDGGIRFVSFMEADLLRSTDQGQTWTTLAPGLDYHSVHALTVTPRGTLIVAGQDTLLTSQDGGATWQRGGVGLEGLLILAVESGAGERLFAVALDPRSLSTLLVFFVSTDEGATWTPINTQNRGLFSSDTILAADPQGGLYATGGQTAVARFVEQSGVWTASEIALNAEQLPILDFKIDADGILYAATWDRVMRSEDGGAHWERIDGGLFLEPYVREVRALTIGSDGYLYAGTSTAGVFQRVEPVVTAVAAGPGVSEAVHLATSYPNPFSTQATIAFSLAVPARVTLTVYDLLGREVDRLFDEVVMPAGPHETVWQPTHRAGGVYLYKLIADGAVKTGRMVLIR